MIPVGKNFFRGEKEPEATSIFATDSSGNMVFSSQGIDGFSYGERASIAWTYARIALLLLCVLLMATSILFALIWVFRKLFGGMKDVRHLSVRAAPLLATLCFLALIFCFTKLGARILENSLAGLLGFSACLCCSRCSRFTVCSWPFAFQKLKFAAACAFTRCSLPWRAAWWPSSSPPGTSSACASGPPDRFFLKPAVYSVQP